MKMQKEFENNFLEWYDNLKCKIKCFSIKFSKQEQRKRRKEKKLLEKQIKYERFKAQKGGSWFWWSSMPSVLLEEV